MRIVFLTPTLKLSGGNLVLYRYAKALAQKGHSIYIITQGDKEIEKVENDINIKVFKRKQNKHIENACFFLLSLFEYEKNIPECDVIIPVFFPLVPHAIFAKHKKKTTKIVPLFQDFPQMFYFGKYIFSLLSIKPLINKLSKIICISDPIAKEVEKRAKVAPIIIKNGIEHEFFYKREVQKEDYILFVGSSKSKGLDDFLKAYEIINKKYPHIKAKIVAPLKEDVKNSNIEFLGSTSDRDELAILYSKAFLYVSQSIGDSFGLPPLEAMACGTATVLTETLGAKEYAINKENSMVVPLKQPIKTAEAISSIIEDTNLKSKLEENAIITAKKYTWDNLADEVEKAIL